MRTRTKKILSEAEYLEIERAAETKSEFYNGEMFGLAGASSSHNIIINNIVMALGPRLKSKPCSIYSIDVRVKAESSGLYTYPDIVVGCGEKKFLDHNEDTLLNPTLIFEILSPSTEQYDRTTKFNHYRKIESFKEYLLVAQEKIAVEHFVKKISDEWVFKEYNSMKDTVILKSVKLSLAVKDIYDTISFDKKSTSLR